MISPNREPLTITGIASRASMILEQRLGQRKRKRARRGDLCGWLRHYLPHHYELPFSPLHREMATRMLRMTRYRGTKEGVIAPRGHAKTTMASLGFPLYCVCENLERYIVLAADSTSQAIERLEAIQYELENNQRLADAYPTVVGKGPTWSKSQAVTRNGVKIVALGSRQKFRGSKRRQDRPTLIIPDDLDDDDIPYSPTKRRRNNDWVDRTLLNLGTTKTNIWFNGTAIHRDCVVCRNTKRGIRTQTFAAIQQWPKRMDLWREWEDILLDPSEWDTDVREADAEAFYQEHFDEMNEGAVVLWPEWESLYQLMMLRATIGPRSFEAEKQGNPIDPGTCEWDPRYFEGEDVWFDEWPSKPDVKTMALDPSKGREDKGNCYQAITMLAYADGIIYLDADIARRDVGEMCETFVEHIRGFAPDAAVVEDAVFQELLLDILSDVADEQGLIAPIEGISHEGVRKEVRVRRWGAFITRGQVKFKRRSPGAAMLLDQFKDFPNGEFIDGPDSAEMALRKARRILGGTTSNAQSPW